MTSPHRGSSTTQSADRLLKIAEVFERAGLCRTSLYQEIRAERFPKPVKRGRSSRWLESEINAWIAALATVRDKARRAPQ